MLRTSRTLVKHLSFSEMTREERSDLLPYWFHLAASHLCFVTCITRSSQFRQLAVMYWAGNNSSARRGSVVGSGISHRIL